MRYFPILVCLIFAGVVAANDFLRFPLEKDERHFYESVKHFASKPIPSLDDLSDYNDLNTPLPFLVFGQIEYWTAQGRVLGRYLNLLAALATLFLILGSGETIRREQAAACLGLLIFPYFLGVSTHLYTDSLPAFLLALAFFLASRKRQASAAVCFVLAISARQYMVAFPLALAGFELAVGKRLNEAAVLFPLLSCLSLLGWFALFGGFAPSAAITQQKQTLGTLYFLSFNPSNALALLSSLGFYFVLPELFLFPGKLRLKGNTFTILISFIILFVFFIAFPPAGNPLEYPIRTYGMLDKALHALFSQQLCMAIYFIFSLAALVRFARPCLAAAILLANLVIMLKAHIYWEKYLLPLLVVFWYLEAAAGLDRPIQGFWKKAAA